MLLADTEKKAEEMYNDGYNCAQSVLCAFCPVTGMDGDEAVRLAASFGGDPACQSHGRQIRACEHRL